MIGALLRAQKEVTNPEGYKTNPDATAGVCNKEFILSKI